MSATNAPIAVSSSGDNTIVAARAGYRIRVIGYTVSFNGTVNVQWLSDTGGSAVALTGLIYGTANGGAVVPDCGPNARGWFMTDVGKALNLNLSAGVAVGGHVNYEYVAAS